MVTTYVNKLAALTAAALLAIAVCMTALAGVAYADDEGPDTAPMEPSELQQRVEASAAAYNDAVARAEDLQARIDENSARISQIEADLPVQREKADAAMVSMYKFSGNQTAIADVLMGVRDFDGLVSTLEYLSAVASSNLDQIEKLQDMQQDLADTQKQLVAEKAQAEKAVAEAEQALEEAKAAREEAAAAAAAAVTQAEIDAMREQMAEDAAEAARAEAEESGASEEEAQAQADAAAEAAAAAVDANTVGNGGVDWSLGRDQFIDEWGNRIDDYLEGSPMAGQGSNFAAAAWDYGVDPRWSPAIANTESTKGQYTFADHNAWGWGSSSWDNWEDAINDHVKGLADGYGSTITQEGAERYCPPNADEWYDNTLGEMNRI